MSTEYETRPGRTYDEAITRLSDKFQIEESAGIKYVGRHCLLRDPAGSSLHMFEWEGLVRFERFGSQDARLLVEIGRLLEADIYDQYGLKYEVGR